MITVDPKDLSIGKLHGHLLGAVVPRPIAFASTIDKEGNVNLSPFSYYNAFSNDPPIVVFSPARRGRDGTTKHSLENVLEVPEAVINLVTYSMVEQMSLSSTEYDKGVDEFVKSGLTAVDSQKVKPPRVGESPVSFECKVRDVISFGEQGGAGNLVICEVVLVHVSEEVLDENGVIDSRKLDVVGRLGGSYYTRVIPESIFEIPKPLRSKGIGVDALPAKVRDSEVLTGNNLGRLGNVEKIPDPSELETVRKEPGIDQIITSYEGKERTRKLHILAKETLENGDTETALAILLLDQ